MRENPKIPRIIDTITSKVVLILGAFKTERKEILDALRDELRERSYSSVVFDFDQPGSRELTDTVKVLAQLSRFVVIDLTDPRCSPYELKNVYDAAKVPIQSIIVKGQDPFSMFWDLRAENGNRVLEPFVYQNRQHLKDSLGEYVVSPSLAAAQALGEARHRTHLERANWEAGHGRARKDK